MPDTVVQAGGTEINKTKKQCLPSRGKCQYPTYSVSEVVRGVGQKSRVQGEGVLVVRADKG